jgi:hypothetical protein
MKTKLFALILGAALVGSSTLALAGPGHNGRHDRARAEQGHQPHWKGNQARKDRVYRGPERHTRGHGPKWHKGHGSRWNKGHRHARGWSKHRHHSHYAKRAAPHRSYKRHVRHDHRRKPVNNLSIILHGHF